MGWNETRLADMRDLAETPADLLAAYKYAMKGYQLAGNDFLARMSYRTAADDLIRRYHAAKKDAANS